VFSRFRQASSCISQELIMNKNFFISYDLNGPRPTHAEMDKHLAKAGAVRVLETVWHMKGQTKEAVFAYVDQLLSQNDRLLVIDAADARFRNLLVPDATIQGRWPATVPTGLLPPAPPRPIGVPRRQ
jgi:hypothetical protein